MNIRAVIIHEDFLVRAVKNSEWKTALRLAKSFNSLGIVFQSRLP